MPFKKKLKMFWGLKLIKKKKTHLKVGVAAVPAVKLNDGLMFGSKAGGLADDGTPNAKPPLLAAGFEF